MTEAWQDRLFAMIRLAEPARAAAARDILADSGFSDGREFALSLLRESLSTRVGDDVEAALIACGRFGVDSSALETLSQLVRADWHTRHEDVVWTLDGLRDVRGIPALVYAADWVPDYLDWDENRALARKAVWAIGKIPGPEADRALQELVHSTDGSVRKVALHQIDRRRENGGVSMR